MKRLKIILFNLLIICGCTTAYAETVRINTDKRASNRIQFAAEFLQKKLAALGYQVQVNHGKGEYRIQLSQAKDTANLKKEGFTIVSKGKTVKVIGNDGSGVIYACVEMAERVKESKGFHFPNVIRDAPEMVLRGTNIGMQKTYYLLGRAVYEYPYTPENFPWFYDKKRWIEYLDMMVENRMNSLYLWNGHPFASLVKLKDYPFAVEVDDATFEKNKDIFSFLTHEADKRGIYVIQMFYNIIVSKPFAEHYGIKTQDRHVKITPLLSDYTRKSIAAFIENYPNLGLLTCLAEAMDTEEDDVEWLTKTIIPGIKDGLRALGRTDEPPLLIRAHDTNIKKDIEAALPLYNNLYTMWKYNGESLTTYQPQGPWAERHREMAALGSTHISNVHILANLEPWRWGAPDFVRKCVVAMHEVHHANALHLYPQASYWDYPYTADRLADGNRLEQIKRDWIWYKEWGRYAWNCHRDRQDEDAYWNRIFSDYYGLSKQDADNVRVAYEESGEIAPKLLRRFGITEGNRQTLLLGMFVSQLLNPYKYTVYPDFYKSCGPTGEMLIDYVEKEWKHQPHVGELPLDIVAQTQLHGDKAVKSIDAIANSVTKNRDEFKRLQNDMHCYQAFAYSFGWKVKAAQHILNYKWGKNIGELDAAVPLLERSLAYYRQLVSLTKGTYLYANSMQTAQRRIPISGAGGHMKEWWELLPLYEQELENLKKNIAILKMNNNAPSGPKQSSVRALTPSKVLFADGLQTVTLEKGAQLFMDMDHKVTDLAPELNGLTACVFNGQTQRDGGTKIEFTTDKPVSLLVGYFKDDQRKYAAAPKLETDAAANNYGQADPQLISALRIDGMPLVNVHKYDFPKGHHVLKLPHGLLVVLGFTADKVTPREIGLTGGDEAIDWLMY
ncbi:MAG: hypothetical protein MR450_02425 [Prevotella sp.]|nr:hypothetical protein [Prevotella sp.]MDY4039017.1 glycoside hydrolase family 20 zincin-like fold domain-containing protein [Prevotella sp.]